MTGQFTRVPRVRAQDGTRFRISPQVICGPLLRPREHFQPEATAPTRTRDCRPWAAASITCSQLSNYFTSATTRGPLTALQNGTDVGKPSSLLMSRG